MPDLLKNFRRGLNQRPTQATGHECQPWLNQPCHHWKLMPWREQTIFG